MGFLTDPTVMAPLKEGVGAIGTFAGARLAAQGAKAAGVAASQADLYNAGVADVNSKIAAYNAEQTAQAGEAQVGISQERTREEVNAIKAEQGASGVDVHTASAAGVRGSEAAKGMLDALTTRANAMKEAYKSQQQAENEAAQARLDKSQARYDLKAGKIKASATMLGGLNRAATGYEDYVIQNSLNPAALESSKAGK